MISRNVDLKTDLAHCTQQLYIPHSLYTLLINKVLKHPKLKSSVTQN